MKIISGGSRTGKTYKAVKRCAENALALVVMNDAEKQMVKREYPVLFANIPNVYTFDEILNKRFYGSDTKGFVFDNMDLMVQSLVNFTCVDTGTISPQEIKRLSISDNPFIENITPGIVQSSSKPNSPCIVSGGDLNLTFN